MVDALVELIEQTHREVNAMRKKRGLTPYQFADINKETYDPYAVIRQAISEGEMVDHGFNKISNIECACGCKTLITYAWLNGGRGGATHPRKYISGHKPAAPIVGKCVDRQLNHQAAVAKQQAGPVMSYSPAKIKEMYAAEVNRIAKEKEHLSKTIESVKLEVQALTAKRDEMDAEQFRMQNLIEALDIVIEKRQIPKIEHIRPTLELKSSDYHLHKDFGNDTHQNLGKLV